MEQDGAYLLLETREGGREAQARQVLAVLQCIKQTQGNSFRIAACQDKRREIRNYMSIEGISL